MNKATTITESDIYVGLRNRIERVNENTFKSTLDSLKDEVQWFIEDFPTSIYAKDLNDKLSEKYKII